MDRLPWERMHGTAGAACMAYIACRRERPVICGVSVFRLACDCTAQHCTQKATLAACVAADDYHKTRTCRQQLGLSRLRSKTSGLCGFIVDESQTATTILLRAIVDFRCFNSESDIRLHRKPGSDIASHLASSQPEVAARFEDILSQWTHSRASDRTLERMSRKDALRAGCCRGHIRWE